MGTWKWWLGLALSVVALFFGLYVLLHWLASLNLDPLIWVIIVFFVCLHILGIFYAWQIELAPSPHGWTWVSVVVGDAFTDIAMMSIIFIGLIYFYGLDAALKGWPLMTVPVLSHLTSGIPMITGQLLKRRYDNRLSKEISATLRPVIKTPEITQDVSHGSPK